jgi:lipopolysaccharide/colanic/teichoic acid biosynthesis glycosyltransferase
VEAGERIVAALSLAALSPFLLAIWAAILVLSRRPPLIAHRRVGRYGTELWVLKFRTMWDSTVPAARCRPFLVERIDDQAGPSLKGPCDSRVPGRFAKFCRRHSLDELPQLVHVLTGRMSLVGPRPVTPAELHSIYGASASMVIRAKPGLTGLWQVSGRNRLTDEQRSKLDLECARGISVRLYFAVLLRTIPAVLWGAGAW